MKEVEKFLVHCKMTCFGGSEKGSCPCTGPKECEVSTHPKYDYYRSEAVARMKRFFLNSLPADSEE